MMWKEWQEKGMTKCWHQTYKEGGGERERERERERATEIGKKKSFETGWKCLAFPAFYAPF